MADQTDNKPKTDTDPSPSSDDPRIDRIVPAAGKKRARGKPAADGAEDPQVGVALRSVYQRAVEEAVPDEMLDLLSKLG